MDLIAPSTRVLQLPHSTESLPSSQEEYMVRNWRYAACGLLTFACIPHAYWFEDVLAYHNEDVANSELCLLVDRPSAAAPVLMAAGYQRSTSSGDNGLRLQLLGRQVIFLAHPVASTEVILLSAGEWHYSLRMNELHEFKCPWLPQYVDSLMTYWLGCPPEQYEARRLIMDYVADMVIRCYHLYDHGQSDVREGIAMYLNPLHLALHYDIDARCGDILQHDFEFQERHAYHVQTYNQIKAGKVVPRPYKRNRFYPRLQTLLE